MTKKESFNRITDFPDSLCSLVLRGKQVQRKKRRSGLMMSMPMDYLRSSNVNVKIEKFLYAFTF
ncbi:MAG: hypothetical protein KAT65_20380 [Methanophagales archaeon]|nr:hypothetical protein [Methanophagales archaeon]